MRLARLATSVPSKHGRAREALHANISADHRMSTTELPVVELSAKDLPAFCPNPAMPVWNHHPRVFLDVTQGGEAMCPYCGTKYRLKAGEVPKGHH
jgi:uncharacterized Zn-finger protein